VFVVREIASALGLVFALACGGAPIPDQPGVSPADRALPEPASRHPTDGPTATRTSAQGPVVEEGRPPPPPCADDDPDCEPGSVPEEPSHIFD
jgi:hypothetical protein